ncbi:MAG TPA: STAS domain-containing protein [Symbiobacteriaceae bacterium]|nr:STAS domain-containing protein [Symbiobacteriaceae bacterium]
MFELQVRMAAGTVILDIAGPLAREGGDAVCDAVQALAPLPAHLVLNFSRAGMISTAGLGGLLWAVRLVTRAGGRVSAYGLNDHFRKVFHVVGITQFVSLYYDEAAALQGVAP